MDKLLQELKDKVDQAELYRISSRTVPINFRAGKLESIKSHAIDGIALRVVVNGRLGFATTTDLTDTSELVAAAIASAKFGEPMEFTFAPPTSPADVPAYDPQVANLPEDTMIEIATRAVTALKDADPEADVNLSLERTEETVIIANTNGLELTERRTMIAGGGEVGKANPGDIFIIFDSTQSRYLDAFDMDRVVNRIVRYLSYGKKIVSVPSKPMPVVFTQNGTIAILLPLLVGFNGKSVYMGTSPLKGRIGERAFDPRLSIADDGTIPRGPHSAGFDDEGTPTARTPLISEGIVTGFIYDRRTAALAKAEPTGNGYKGGIFSGGGFRTPPSAGASNIIVAPGDISEKELIAGIDEGLLVDSVLGLGQGNINSGEFSNNVAVAFKIERGEVVGRVKNTMIAGNAYELLKDHLIGLGAETEFVHGALRTPMIAVDGVNVVGQ